MARPRFNDRFSHVPLFVWVLVELMRDHKDSRPRDTVRAASKRLQTKNCARISRVAVFCQLKQFAGTIRTLNQPRGARTTANNWHKLCWLSAANGGNFSDGMSVRGSG